MSVDGLIEGTFDGRKVGIKVVGTMVGLDDTGFPDGLSVGRIEGGGDGATTGLFEVGFADG